MTTSDQPADPGDKATLRRAFRDARDRLPLAVRESAASRISLRVAELVFPHLPAGAVLGVYAAKESEVATREIAIAARARGLTLAYPRIVEGSRRLAFHRADPEALLPGRFAIAEPAADAPPVEPSALAAVLVPGLAFDRHGYRLGWGQGFYDATIEAIPLRVGLAYDSQIVAELPHREHDVPVHVVITELALHRAT